MIEPKFTFLEMEKEILPTNAAAFRQPGFRGAPKAFNPIDVDAASAHEDALAMFDAEMFAIAEVDQAVIADPAVGVNHARQGHPAANNGPQSGLFRIGDDLRVDPPATLKDAEDDGLAAGAPPAFAADA